jgi:exodeoxyribonuclease VII large subunit
VFGCRTPVVSAVGHETDSPLVDYVADARASTPTDAAKRIVPDLGDESRLMEQARYRLRRAMTQMIDREQHRLDALRTRPALAKPHAVLDQLTADVHALRERASRCLRHRLDRADDGLRHTTARLRGLSPAATMNRGYAIVQRAGGAVVRAPGEVTSGERLRVRLAGGELGVTVTDEDGS